MTTDAAIPQPWRRQGCAGWLIVSLIAVPLCIAFAVTLGPADITFAEVWTAIGRRVGIDSGMEMSPIRDRIVWELRLPRAFLAACVGAGLALCGTILQSLMRNPLADPYLLGISSGASVGAVLAIVVGIGGLTIGLPFAAFTGAALAFACVMTLAGRSAMRASGSLILAGVATTHLFSAISSLITMLLADANATRGVFFWLLGSLSAARWPEVFIVAAVLTLIGVICLMRVNELDAFTFGSDAAQSLGIRVGRVRILLFTLTALLTATLVAFSGAIGFIGLVIPHAARLVVGPAHGRLLPASVLIGAIFTVLVDTAARTLFAPVEIPAGVITALIGVPAFAIILYRQLRR